MTPPTTYTVGMRVVVEGEDMRQWTGTIEAICWRQSLMIRSDESNQDSSETHLVVLPYQIVKVVS
jgi:hypothetical protein